MPALRRYSFIYKIRIAKTSMEIRGGNISMAGKAIAIPGVLNISETGDRDTIGKIW